VRSTTITVAPDPIWSVDTSSRRERLQLSTIRALDDRLRRPARESLHRSTICALDDHHGRP
jgi:hypothetical protein